MTSNGQISAWSAVSQWLQCPVDEELPASQAGRNGNVRRRYIAQRVSWVGHWTKSLSFIIHWTPLDSDGLWTQDLRNKHLQESTCPKLWEILQNPKCQCSCFFFLIFLINPWDFFPGYPLGIPFLERPGGRRARKEQ